MNVGFEKVFLLQNTLNLPASEVIATYVYKIGIINASFSFGAAVGLFNSVINFAILIAVNTLATPGNGAQLVVANYGGRIRESRGDRIFLGFVFAFLTFVLATIVYPLIFIVSSSFSSGQAVGAGRVWLLPVEPTLVGYATVFRNSTILVGYINSAVYTVFGTLINIFVTVLVAYPLSSKDFFGGKFIVLALVFTMMFAGGLIPLYLDRQEGRHIEHTSGHADSPGAPRVAGDRCQGPFLRLPSPMS